MTESSSTPSQSRSLESRFRRWTGQYSGVELDEKHLKDRAASSDSVGRRWGIITVGLSVVITTSWAGWIEVSALAIGIVAMAAVVVNLAVSVIVGSGWYRWWFVYLLAMVDIALVSTLVVLFGSGGLVVVFLVAILPYTFDEGRAVGELLALLAGVAYIAAAALNGALIATPPVGFAELPRSLYVETFVFLLVAVALRRTPASLVARLRITRGVIGQAESGALGVRAPATGTDDLGFLEKSFNRMLDEIADTFSAVQREADEVVILADVLSQGATGVLASSESVAATSAELAKDMSEQKALADASRGESTDAAAEAGGLRDRAERVASDARSLVEAAEHGRVSVQRASETLLAIGEEVRMTGESVKELGAMSERIGSFAQTISRIARQTHVLALNAAIEAAHAEGGGEGFAAVADEVRALAAEAARSAREMADLIGDLQARVDAVSRAMASGQDKVRDVGGVADEAQRALGDLHRGISQITDVVEATAAISRSQANRMAGLAERMADVASISARSSTGADGAAAAMATQKGTIGDLSAVSGQLADLAERVRASVARFSVEQPED